VAFRVSDEDCPFVQHKQGAATFLEICQNSSGITSNVEGVICHKCELLWCHMFWRMAQTLVTQLEFLR
jgi:hypothetical protein